MIDVGDIFLRAEKLEAVEKRHRAFTRHDISGGCESCAKIRISRRDDAANEISV
jgi:hypothetical protein